MSRTTLSTFTTNDLTDLAALVSRGGDEIANYMKEGDLEADGHSPEEITSLRLLSDNAPILISKLQGDAAQLADHEALNRAVADSPTKLSALFAERIVNNYNALTNGNASEADDTRPDRDELEASMRDLVTDMMHLAHGKDIDFDQIMDDAENRFLQELED